MKKLLAIILILATSLLIVSCNRKDDTKINVGYLAGPTGIGMAKMINDHPANNADEKYTFQKFTAPNTAITDLNAGLIDIACVSTEVAAKFYNQGYDFKVLAINCLNSICLLTNDNVSINSIEDLEGTTIYTSKQGTPKLILKALLDAYGVSAEISHSFGEGDEETTINSPDQIAPVIVQNKVDIVLAPVHVAYNAMANPNTKHKITLDIDSLWNAEFETPIAMGCIIARTDFINEHPQAVESFLKEYKQSIEYMSNVANNETAAEYVVNSTILSNLAPAKNTLNKLSGGLKFIDGSDMKKALIGIYQVFGLEEIGNKLPDDNFYYEK